MYSGKPSMKKKMMKFSNFSTADPQMASSHWLRPDLDAPGCCLFSDDLILIVLIFWETLIMVINSLFQKVKLHDWCYNLNAPPTIHKVTMFINRNKNKKTLQKDHYFWNKQTGSKIVPGSPIWQRIHGENKGNIFLQTEQLW